MGLIRFLRAHVDSLVAVALAGAFLLEAYLAEDSLTGESFITGLEADEAVALAAGTAFMLSLALRSRMPAVPLALAFVALAILGRGELEASTSLLVGLALTAYSVGAWSGGRAAVVGALGVGALTGLLVMRAGGAPAEPRDIAGPVFVLIGAWLVGLLVRSVRVGRSDERVTSGLDWTGSRGYATPDSAGHDEVVRELRTVVERAMSTVILEARNARRSMRDDPRATDRSLTEVETAGTEALEEAQRLTGLLLTPDGAPLPELGPGLADVEFLAEEVTKAGLPVDSHVSGRPLPLTPDLDATAYRVVHEALMSALESTRDATAHVFVRYEPDVLEVEIVDDGKAVGGNKEETQGLLAVRKDVAALGGTLDAGPGDDGGYWVLAQFPYEPDWS